MKPSHFDFVIIGAGQAGGPLARDLAAAGKSVALIERKHLGGSCINFGCTPTKDALASAKLAYDARRASEFGLEIPTVRVRFDEVMGHARRLVEESKVGLEKNYQGEKAPKLLRLHARLNGRDEQGRFRIQAGDQALTADQVILDTGTRSLVPEIEGLDPKNILTAENWIELTELPEKIAFLGSGYIGLEMGQLYHRLGSEVTLLEAGPQIISHEDADVSETMLKSMQAEGIEFKLNTQLKKVEGQKGRYHLTLSSGSLDVTHIFVATGRKPNTDDLGLETVGVKTNAKGFVECDSRLATSVEGIWVAGDLRGGPMFTHTSWDDYRILSSQLLGDGKRTTERVVPYAVFTDPELGRVGLTEGEARKSGIHPIVARFEFADNIKAIVDREANGFIKVVIDPRSDQILGAAVLGHQGAELVHIYGTLMNARAPYTVIRDEIMIHPTLSEAIQSAVSSVPKTEGKKSAA